MARNTGLGLSEASALLRPTAPPADPGDAEPAPLDDVETEGTGETNQTPAPTRSAPRSRRKRASTAAADLKARNVRLSDDVHERLFQLARQRKTSISVVANDLLDKALPRYEVKRVG